MTRFYPNEDNEFLIKNWKSLSEEEIEFLITKVNFDIIESYYQLDSDFIKRFKDHINVSAYIILNASEDQILELLPEVKNIEQTVESIKSLQNEKLSEDFLQSLALLCELNK